MRDVELDEKYMKMALKEAEQAGQEEEVHVCAILVKGDQVLLKDHNRGIKLNDPTAHARFSSSEKQGKCLGIID